MNEPKTTTIPQTEIDKALSKAATLELPPKKSESTPVTFPVTHAITGSKKFVLEVLGKTYEYKRRHHADDKDGLPLVCLAFEYAGQMIHNAKVEPDERIHLQMNIDTASLVIRAVKERMVLPVVMGRPMESVEQWEAYLAQTSEEKQKDRQ